MLYQAELRYLVPKGILYPVVGAFRALIQVDANTGIYSWKKDPFVVQDELGDHLAQIVWDEDEKEENPECLGKSRNLKKSIAISSRLLSLYVDCFANQAGSFYH